MCAACYMQIDKRMFVHGHVASMGVRVPVTPGGRPPRCPEDTPGLTPMPEKLYTGESAQKLACQLVSLAWP